MRRRRNRGESGRAYSAATSRAQVPALFGALTQQGLLTGSKDYGSWSQRLRIPAIFLLLVRRLLRPGSVNLDIGGGRWNHGTSFLRRHGVTNLVFDPGNRTEAHNQSVLRRLKRRKARTATIANVLNVIPARKDRVAVLRFAKQHTSGPVYIMSYEGNQSGRRSRTRDGWQLNRRPAAYLPEIREVFRRVRRVGPMIIAE